MKDEDIKDKFDSKKMLVTMLLNLLTRLLYMLSFFCLVQWLQLNTLSQYLVLNFLIWIGFILIVHYDALLWELKNLDYLIFGNTGERLVAGIAATIVAYYLNPSLPPTQ